MAGIANVELLVAAMDLKLVQLLRGAMRAADLAAGIGKKLGAPGGDSTPAPKLAMHPQPKIEPRRVIHPTPHFEPRRVIHVRPQLELLPATPPANPEQPREHSMVLQPPWKTLPWENVPQPAKPIKVVVRKPDSVPRGTMVDLFV